MSRVLTLQLPRAGTRLCHWTAAALIVTVSRGAVHWQGPEGRPGRHAETGQMVADQALKRQRLTESLIELTRNRFVKSNAGLARRRAYGPTVHGESICSPRGQGVTVEAEELTSGDDDSDLGFKYTARRPKRKPVTGNVDEV